MWIKSEVYPPLIPQSIWLTFYKEWTSSYLFPRFRARLGLLRIAGAKSHDVILSAISTGMCIRATRCKQSCSRSIHIKIQKLNARVAQEEVWNLRFHRRKIPIYDEFHCLCNYAHFADVYVFRIMATPFPEWRARARKIVACIKVNIKTVFPLLRKWQTS